MPTRTITAGAAFVAVLVVCPIAFAGDTAGGPSETPGAAMSLPGTTPGAGEAPPLVPWVDYTGDLWHRAALTGTGATSARR